MAQPVNNERLQQVLRYVVHYKQTHDGNSPTLTEISAGLELNSTSLVLYYLRQLERDGKLTMPGKGRSRGICVTGGQWSMVTAVGN